MPVDSAELFVFPLLSISLVFKVSASGPNKLHNVLSLQTSEGLCTSFIITVHNGVDSINIQSSKWNVYDLTAATRSLTELAMGLYALSFFKDQVRRRCGGLDGHWFSKLTAQLPRDPRLRLFLYAACLSSLSIVSDFVLLIDLFLWRLVDNSTLCATVFNEAYSWSYHINWDVRPIEWCTPSAKRPFELLSLQTKPYLNIFVHSCWA